MIKRLLLLMALFGFILSTTSCSSKKTEGEEGTPEAEASAEAGEDADFAEEDSEEGGDEFAEEGTEEGGDEFAEEGTEEGGDEFAEEGTEEGSGEGGDEFAEEGTEEGSGEGGDEFAEEDSGEGSDASSELALDEGSSESETLSSGATEQPSFEEPEMDDADEKPSWIPVKKIAELPFMKAGVLANAVYLARPGDTAESVSQKIFGDSTKVEQIFSVNPNLRNRGVKTGDKVYYNSPQRPADDSRLLVFYEDVGLQPETYVSQSGDNIREVAKQLLGDDNSWKEIWATNMDVESKTVLPEGTSLKYWSGTSLPMAANNRPSQKPMIVAKNDFPPPLPDEPEDLPPPPPPPDFGAEDFPPPPPPPPDDFANNDVPPPPPDNGAMGTIEPPPPPPPPPAEEIPKPVAKKASGGLGSDPDETMALGAAAIILLAAIALIVMVKKRKQRQALADFANTQTHTQID